jgi:hypothetical protein
MLVEIQYLFTVVYFSEHQRPDRPKVGDLRQRPALVICPPTRSRKLIICSQTLGTVTFQSTFLEC